MILRSILIALAALGAPAAAIAAEPAACRTVRLSDVGWTDITATTALTATVLKALGYRPEITVLSLPVLVPPPPPQALNRVAVDSAATR